MNLEGEAAADRQVTVARFISPVEAQMAVGMLESAGVACELTGENVNNLLGPAFRVRLQVKAEDESAARELLTLAVEDDGNEG